MEREGDGNETEGAGYHRKWGRRQEQRWWRGGKVDEPEGGDGDGDDRGMGMGIDVIYACQSQ